MKRIFLLVTSLIVVTISAQAFALNDSQTSVTWNSDPDALIVSYQDIWAEFDNQDMTPLIRIYGDGRVLVHYPTYTPKAGQYELWLNPSELEQLLVSFSENGMATFDAKSVNRLKTANDNQLRNAAAGTGAPQLFMVACDSTSVFTLNLTGINKAGNKLSTTQDGNSVAWMGLRTDADRYPSIAAIQKLHAAEMQLRGLLERDNLKKVVAQ